MMISSQIIKTSWTSTNQIFNFINKSSINHWNIPW